MKKYLKFITLAIITIFIFNYNFVFAEENDFEENKVEEVVKEKEEDKKEDKVVEDNKEESNKEENVVEDKKEENNKEEKVVEGNNIEEKEEDKIVEETNEIEEEKLLDNNEEEVVVEKTNTNEKDGASNNKSDAASNGGIKATSDGNENNSNNSNIPVQKVKVFISKVDEKHKPLKGAKLQVLDSNGNVLDEWISNGMKHVIMLPNGTYTLREVSAPKGYDKAEDKEFTVEVKVEVGYQANTYNPNIPCEAATTYTVEIKGKVHEVYCINQYLTQPGPGADYNGKILTPEDVRNYTQQTVYKDPYYNPGAPEATANHGHVTENPIDVSDQTLSNQELYDVLLDIVYRRTKAREQERFSDIDALPDEAISYLTETALKNYTNAGVTQIQMWRNLQPGDEAIYEQESSTKYWYLMHMYKDYVYDPDSPNGFRVDIGHGDSLGNFARHWTIDKPLHETKNLSVDHPIYAEFYYYLLGDSTSSSMTHPEDMYIYIYQAANVPEDDEGYQNLLGITGYIEDFEQEMDVEMENTPTKRNITVNKVWSDKDNYEHKRPASVKVKLYANKKLVSTVVLNEENEWKYEWTDLPAYKNGKEIKYTITENKVKNYKTVIEGNMKVGFTIINSYPSNHKNPPTDDSIVFYILLLIISLYGGIRYIYSYKKNY